MRLISTAFAYQPKSSVCFMAPQDFYIFLCFLYHLQNVDNVCKPNMKKVNIKYRIFFGP